METDAAWSKSETAQLCGGSPSLCSDDPRRNPCHPATSWYTRALSRAGIDCSWGHPPSAQAPAKPGLNGLRRRRRPAALVCGPV